MPIRVLVLLLAGALLYPSAAHAESGFALSFTLLHSVGYAPDIDELSTSQPFAFNFAYRIKPKVALGISAEAYRSQVETSPRNGKTLDEITAIPINIAGYYYPLEKTFNPYLVGQIGPVIATEHFSQVAGDTVTESSATAIGPMIGFGVGMGFRWPVTPLAEVKCQYGRPGGERVDDMVACGLSVGVAMSF